MQLSIQHCTRPFNQHSTLKQIKLIQKNYIPHNTSIRKVFGCQLNVRVGLPTSAPWLQRRKYAKYSGLPRIYGFYAKKSGVRGIYAWIYDCVMNTTHNTSIPRVFGCSLNLRVGLTLRVGSSGVNTPSVRVHPASTAYTPRNQVYAASTRGSTTA